MGPKEIVLRSGVPPLGRKVPSGGETGPDRDLRPLCRPSARIHTYDMSDSLATLRVGAPRDGSPHGGTPRRAGGRPVLRSLARDECEFHLREGGIGRVVMSSDRGPLAVPVQYEYTDGLILFSTDPAKASRVRAQGVVGFEVDRFDDFLTHGWSVQVTGRPRLVEGHGRLSSFDLACWNDGRIHTLVAITPEEMTGLAIV